MNTIKAIGGSLGAILVLVITQIIAQIGASLLVMIKIPVGVCNIIAGIIYVVLAYNTLKLFAEKIFKSKMEDFGIPKFSIKVRWIVVAILLPTIVASIYILLFAGEFISSDMDSSTIFSTLSAGVVFSGVAAGFVEEMVFRGFILNILKSRWNTLIAVLVPSVLFGFVHILGMDFSIVSCLLVILAGTMVGIMFSMIALEGGSIWNSGIVHAIWNIVIIGGGLSINQTVDEYSVMTYVLKSKSFVLTGGEFGIESSAISILCYVVVILLAICMMQRNSSSSLNVDKVTAHGE